MAGRRIEVQVFPAFRREVSVPWLRRVVQQALSSSGCPFYGLSLVIADDETVQRLNRDYRGLDETTDVLAFAFDPPAAGHYEGEGTPPFLLRQQTFVTPPEEAGFAGEVIVSYPQCLSQAATQGHTVHDELALLITHGVLHLLGYDHATPQEEGVMKARERAVLTELGAARARR